jgi:hypothetical protein
VGSSSKPGPMCTTNGNYIDFDTLNLQLSPLPGPVCGYNEMQSRVDRPSPRGGDEAGRRALNTILDAVDQNAELKGACVVLKFPIGDALWLRESAHASGLATIVLADIQLSQPAQQQTWWDKWNGVVLNCGGAAISWVGVGASAAAEIPSVGTSTILLYASVVGATSTTAQCGLAVAKVSSEDFQEYVQSKDGQWINTADIVLDVISLGGGLAGAVSAVRGGGALLKVSRYAEELEKLPKGKLLKMLVRLEKTEKELDYFRQGLAKAIKMGKVADPASRGISANLLKRALPIMTSSLKKEVISSLASVVGQALSTWSSYYGGVGSKNLGIVRIVISILQESILDK